MKIAIVRRECGNSWGGAERYCAQIVKTLSEFGHEVTLIARERESACAEVNFIPIQYKAWGSILKNSLFFVKVRRLLLQTGFDVVYGLSRVYPVDIFRISDPLHAAWIQERYQNELVRRLTAFSVRHRLLLALEEKLVADPRVKVIAISKLVASQIEQFYGLSQSSARMHVIYNGVDLQQFNPAVRESGKLLREKLGLQRKTILLFVGGNLKRKGFETLIKGMSSMGREDICLLAVGLARENVPFRLPANVKDRIFFMGRVSNPEMYYGAADLLVMPSRSDPFGNVVLESLACGTPVLTTTAAGASEIIEPGKTGFIMEDPRSHNELRERLEDYLSLASSKMVTMSEQAAHQATQYTWAKHGEMLLQVFQDIVE
jgi:UDP-glucose:(heptosyl)LPS alpha-1,3-glucosyltransferase